MKPWHGKLGHLDDALKTSNRKNFGGRNIVISSSSVGLSSTVKPINMKSLEISKLSYHVYMHGRVIRQRRLKEEFIK